MAFKFIILSALVATVANAGLLPSLNYQTSHLSHSPLNQHKVVLIDDIHGGGGDDDDYHHAPAHYAFSYNVHDPHTGDIKSQKEIREGDVVKGEYSLVEPDGHIRTVKYAADKHSGFNAVVHREAIAHHHQPIAVKTIAAPILSYHSSPIQSYSSPIQSYSSPIQSYSSHGPALTYSYGH